MTETEIRTIFHINRESEVPIYQQMEERLRRFIRDAPDGTRLPSERAIGEALTLSRQTIKSAIRQLTEEGLLRCTRKGTFTCDGETGDETPTAEPEAAPLSFVRYLGSAERTTSLRLLLFETHPNQQLFWQKSVRDFNAQRHGVRAEIDFLPALELPPRELQHYLAGKPADLIQFSSHFDQATEQLAPLPLDLQQELRDPALCLRELYDGAPEEVLTNLLPIYTNFYGCYFNEGLLAAHRLAPFANRFPCRDILPVLEELRRAVPEPPYITGTIGDFILAYGVHDGFRVEEFTPFLEQLDRMRGRNLIHSDITMATSERLEDQFSGRQFFMLDWSGLVLDRFTDTDHRIGMTPLQPPPGRKIYGAASYLGIHRGSRKQGEATLFLNYLLSEPVQRRVVRELNTIPYHRSAIDFLCEAYPAYDRAWWETTVSRISACRYGDWARFVSREVTDIFRDLLAGTLPLKRAVEKIQLRYAGRVKL